MLVEIAFWRSLFCKLPIAVLVGIPQSAPSLSPHNAPTIGPTAAILIVICIFPRMSCFNVAYCHLYYAYYSTKHSEQLKVVVISIV